MLLGREGVLVDDDAQVLEAQQVDAPWAGAWSAS